MQRREAFRRWLQSEKIKKTGKPIPEKTIISYTRGVHKLSDVMYETGIISKRLYSMNTPGEVEQAINRIKREHMYINMNEESENKLHKALNYYLKFMNELNEAEIDALEIEDRK